MRDPAPSPERPADIVLAGVVVTLTTLPFDLSLGALIFAGPLAAHVGVGVGLVLFSALILGLVGERLSGRRGTVVLIQDKTAVILAAAAAVVTGEVLARDPDADPLPTVLVLLAIGTLVTGATMWTLGRLRLGRLVRFVPYPVVAGFLGGTGGVLLLGAVEVMAHRPFAVGHLAPGLLVRWLPGLLFGAFLAWWSGRSRSKLAIPQALAVGTALCFAALWAGGVAPGAAMADGWLLGPLPGGVLWPPALPTAATIDGAALLHGLPNLGPLAIVAVLGLLLNISSAEAVTDSEYDLDRELRANGVANLATGCSAGLPGYMAVGSTLILHRMAVRSRWPAIFAALANGAFLLIGAAPLAWIPRWLLGGLLVFLGIDLLGHALRDARAQLPVREFVLVLVIFAVIVAWGFLAGVGVGLLISVALFAVDSSRVDLIRQSASGAELRSNIARASRHQSVLDAHGAQIRVLQLQGYIFFGSAHRLLHDVTGELDGGAALRFVVADFRQVVGLDCSAAATLARLQRRLHARGVALVCTGLTPAIERLLTIAGCELEGASAQVRADLDHGLEFCEERLLADAGASRDEVRLADEFAALAGDPSLLPRLLAFAAHVDLPAGAAVFAASDAGDGLYLIESGSLTAWLAVGDSRRRLRTMGPGTMIGEAGPYLQAQRSAAVVCDTPARLHHLSNAALARMQAEAPQLLAELHRVVASMLADRLVRTTAALQRRFHVS